MLNLLKSKKAEFFIISAVVIVMFAFLISRMTEPASIPDTSSVAVMEEPFIFNNIVEKARETVEKAKSCDELKFNLEEFKIFSEDFVGKKGYSLLFNYTIVNYTIDDSNCDAATVNFKYIILQSPRITLSKSFVYEKLFQ